MRAASNEREASLGVAAIEATSWRRMFGKTGEKHFDDELAEDTKKSMLAPVSKAYELALTQYYRPQIQRRMSKIESKLGSKMTSTMRQNLQRLGLGNGAS